MIILQGPRARVSSTLFAFDARNCIDELGLYGLSYGRRVGAVVTRPSRKRLVDQNGRVLVSPVGGVNPSRFGLTTGVLFEGAGRNLVSSPEDLASWSNDGVTVTPNFLTAPDGRSSMSLLTPSGLTSQARFTPLVFTGNGRKSASVYWSLVGSQNSGVSIYDATAGVHRHYVAITASGSGAPVLSTVAGSGVRYAVEGPFIGGSYRILFAADGVIAGNNNLLYCYPDRVGGTLAAGFWGGTAENAEVPSSYLPDTTTRSADACYFDLPALNPPRDMSFYARGVERGTRMEPGAYLWQVSLNNANPRIHVNRTIGTPRMQLQTVSAAGVFSTVERAAGADTAVGDLAEYRSQFASDGGLEFGTTLNSGEELVSSGAGAALGTAWSAPRLYIGANGAGAAGRFALSNMLIMASKRSRAELRDLAGV